MSNATKHNVYLVITYLVTSGLNYIFGVILSWFFSPAQFGVLGVTQSLLLLLALVVGSGFAWTAAHDMARGGVTDENREKFRTSWLMNLGMGLIVGVGIWVAYAFNILDLGTAYRNIIPLIGLTIVFLAIRAVTNGVMRGLYRFEPLAVNLLLEVMIKIAVGVSLVALGMGVVGVMLGFVVGAGASLAHSLLVVRQDKLWKGSWRIDRNVITATIPLFIGMLGTALMLNLDVIGLKLFAANGLGDILSGYYQAAVILARVPVFLAQALTLVLFSYAAGAIVQDEDQKQISVYFRTAFRSWLRFLMPIGLILVVIPGEILHLMFPPQYQQSSDLLRIAALGGLILSLVTMLNGILQASGYKRGSALSTAFATLCQIGVLLWLVPGYGAAGAAVSLVIAGIIALSGMIMTYFWRTAKTVAPMSARRLLRAIFREALPILTAIVLLIILPNGSRSLILIKIILVGVTYLLILFAVQTRNATRPQVRSNPLMSLIQLVIGG